jgi:hypothetical protein
MWEQCLLLSCPFLVSSTTTLRLEKLRADILTVVARNPVRTPSHHRTRLPAQPESAVVRESREQMEEPKYFANHGHFREFGYNPG